jgi:hypothetical protein
VNRKINVFVNRRMRVMITLLQRRINIRLSMNYPTATLLKMR